MVRNEGPLGTSTTWRVHFGGSRMMTNAEKGANLAARTAVEDFDRRDEVLSREFSVIFCTSARMSIFLLYMYMYYEPRRSTCRLPVYVVCMYVIPSFINLKTDYFVCIMLHTCRSTTRYVSYLKKFKFETLP